MGKKPLAGLIGLVTAGMLVTAGCGECCRKNTRPNGDNYKPTPTFPAKMTKGDPAAPADRTSDKQLSPAEPVKPLEAPLAPLSDNKTGSQPALTPPGGTATTGV